MNETNGNAGLARIVVRAALVLDGLMLFFTLCSAANNNGGGATLLLLSLAVITGLALWYATKQGLWFVMRLERIWRQTCMGINFSGEAPASIWKHGLKGRYIDQRTETITPLLKNICGDWQEFSAEICFIRGQTLEQYQRNAPAFALSLQVPHVQFDLAESGLIRIRAGSLAIPQAYNFTQLEVADS